MRVVPVMDLQGGMAVHAVRGDRAHYEPVTGALVSGGDPRALAQAFCGELGLRELYIADLDAIEGRGNHDDVIADLAQRPDVTVMVDAGITNADGALRVLALGVQQVVAGSETLDGPDSLRALCTRLGPGQLVFSLDMRGGRVLARNPALAALGPGALLELAYVSGCREAILLDLARVGSDAGANLELIAAAHAIFPGLRLLAGGGVRGPADLWQLQRAGADGALVGTALHRGSITRQDIADLAGAQSPSR